MTSVDTESASVGQPAPEAVTHVATTRWGRLVLGQTAFDFWGRRWWGFGLSLALIVISVISLSVQGLNLGLDFTGGVAWDVPAGQLSVDDARSVLDDNGIDGSEATIQERSSDSGDIIKVQVDDQPAEVRSQLQEAFAKAAGVPVNDVSVSSVSSRWGWEITKKAISALVIFLGLIALFISIRFEWRMALSAILAMIHDVLIAVGIYSVFGFVVTPATVIAFLTILGYSLYDTIVVFDRIKENERRFAASGLSAADVVNVSVNQVLLRSLNTSIAAMLPVLSLLLIGAGLLGQVTLQEFALALLVGMFTGAYSSLFVAAPLLGWFKASSPQFARRHADARARLVGDELRAVVVRGSASARPASGRRRATTTTAAAAAAAVTEGVAEAPAPAAVIPTSTASPTQLLSHPPRPRKKKRR
jgi:preprotein translocase subunit SecF